MQAFKNYDNGKLNKRQWNEISVSAISMISLAERYRYLIEYKQYYAYTAQLPDKGP